MEVSEQNELSGVDGRGRRKSLPGLNTKKTRKIKAEKSPEGKGLCPRKTRWLACLSPGSLVEVAGVRLLLALPSCSLQTVYL